jgi:FAD/FMN-containing dehydrogenase
MKRRKFCKTTLAAGIAAAYPFLGACSREEPGPASVEQALAPADTGIEAISLDGARIELEKAAVNEFGAELDGTLMLSGHPRYNETRMIWNGMHDKYPALIAQCATPADVQKAVSFARERQLLLAVRGGGHSWPGKSTCDGGMMLDLSQMYQVAVDTENRIGAVGGGALLGHLDTATLPYGLVTTAGVVSHTGVGGFTLGGGFGRLNRKYGLAVDNLVSAQIVTADGRLLTVSADEDPDLFWAIRGGGGNFGVVTRFDFRLHPFNREVLSGMIMWPVEQAREVLHFYADWHADLSDELYVGPVMVTLPDGGGSFVGMEVVYNGDPESGEAEMAPLRAFGTPADDGIRLQDYVVMQTQEDAAFAHGVRSYIKNGMVREFTRELADAIVETFVPDPRLAFFTHTAGGAVSRVGELDTAFPHRNAQTMIMVGGGWTDPADDEWAISTARAWFAELQPFTGGYYDNINFDRDARAANYGPALDRLARIKGRYDPGNLFRLNNNILPA